MSDHGATTPLQPVGRGSGGAALVVGVALVAVVGLLAWQPWSPTGRAGASPVPHSSDAVAPGGRPGPPAVAAATPAASDPSTLASPTTGPWTGRVAGEWSIVAFHREDRLSHDGLELDQQPVTAYRIVVSPLDFGSGAGGCAEASAHVAAQLPSGLVRFLGVAFPPEIPVTVERVIRLGAGPEPDVVPVALGRISGPEQSPAPSLGIPGWAAPLIDPVRMFALTGLETWPDGLYRFDVVTNDGQPNRLYACIGT